MPSPFPGMDPWLENPRVFGDLHDSLIFTLQESLQTRLPTSYFARKGVRVWLESADRLVEPDVYVMREKQAGVADEYSNVATLGETGPLVVTVDPPPLVEVTERYLDIFKLEEGGRRLVTSIEVLSPTNESTAGQGHGQYLRKQQETLTAGVHLIEIDLLRSGLHTTAVPHEKLTERAGDCDYHVCVHRFDEPQHYFLYPIRMSDALPEIGIPLLPGDPVVTIALQPIFDRSYEAGAFARELRYEFDEVDPPLTDEQRDWAAGILAEHSSR